MKYTLEKFVKTAGGKCAIGSDNEYEWQPVEGVSFTEYSKAKEYAIKFNIADNCRVTDGVAIWGVS